MKKVGDLGPPAPYSATYDHCFCGIVNFLVEIIFDKWSVKLMYLFQSNLVMMFQVKISLRFTDVMMFQNSPNNDVCFTVAVTPAEIIAALQSAKPNKEAGTDRIYPKMLKNLGQKPLLGLLKPRPR